MGNKIKGLMIAANSSGAGKTTAALGLICSLREMGIKAAAAKSGPDYIDAAWLSWASGLPAANLDARMAPEGLERLIKRIPADHLLVIEGAMGLYDGDKNGRGSSAELAARLKIPILLLLNVKGMGQSAAALAQGFLDYQADWMDETGKPEFLGVVCAHSGGAGHEALCRKALEPLLRKRGLLFIGFLPAEGAPRVPSRHLGLKSAAETGLKREDLAAWTLKSCPPKPLLDALGFTEAGAPPKIPEGRRFFTPLKKTRPKAAAAIAFDEAFSFCYADLPAMLVEAGARVLFFSPLHDQEPPPCDGLYFPGGYPELYAEKLSANKSMKAAIRRAAASGVPIYGECGGYIYLGRALRVSGSAPFEMCGLLPLDFEMGGRLAALGYRDLFPAGGNPLPLGGRAQKGHEFHYARACAGGGPPLWKYRAAGGAEAFDGCVKGSVMGAWTHLYPEGSMGFWLSWIDLCVKKRS